MWLNVALFIIKSLLSPNCIILNILINDQRFNFKRTAVDSLFKVLFKVHIWGYLSYHVII